MAGRNRYFLALIPPPPIFDEVLSLKQYLNDHYNSSAALHSPPHITLQMPFEWAAEKEEELAEALQLLSSTLSPVIIRLKNFGCFSPRVIFIHVNPDSGLASLYERVRQFCKEDLGLPVSDHPFHPHITIGFRDLTRPAFNQAWAEFSEKKLKGKFSADRISLLKHDGKKWTVMRDFLIPGAITP